jgi:hypothetical protein
MTSLIKGARLGSWRETRLEYEIPRKRQEFIGNGVRSKLGTIIKREQQHGPHPQKLGLSRSCQSLQYQRFCFNFVQVLNNFNMS